MKATTEIRPTVTVGTEVKQLRPRLKMALKFLLTGKLENNIPVSIFLDVSKQIQAKLNEIKKENKK